MNVVDLDGYELARRPRKLVRLMPEIFAVYINTKKEKRPKSLLKSFPETVAPRRSATVGAVLEMLLECCRFQGQSRRRGDFCTKKASFVEEAP